MDSESVSDALGIIDKLSSPYDSCALGDYRQVPGWKGICIGDCAATINTKVLRVAAFQVAGCIGEVNDWVSDAVSQLQCTGAHVGIFTETRVHTPDRHTRIVNAFRSRGFLALSRNTI